MCQPVQVGTTGKEQFQNNADVVFHCRECLGRTLPDEMTSVIPKNQPKVGMRQSCKQRIMSLAWMPVA